MHTRKRVEFEKILEARIRRGDYAIHSLPTEEELAEEIGTSRTTARRVLLQLMGKGLLVRKPHGRLEVSEGYSRQTRLQLGCLAPAFRSPGFDGWRIAVERAAHAAGASVRLSDYVHYDDPVIPQMLSGFDGVFLVPSSETIPRPILDRFKSSKHLVVLGGDFSEWDIPSVQLLPPMFIDRLGDHLRKLGHRRIDCLNTQPHDATIEKRLERWGFWRQLHQVQGELIDSPVAPYAHPTPHAYEVIQKRLKQNQFTATALLCMTDAAATGAIRALQENGRRVGVDVSVCAVEGSGLARYQWPSRTCLEEPDPAPYLQLCIENMGGEQWKGPILMVPSDLKLFVGESTGQCPRTDEEST